MNIFRTWVLFHKPERRYHKLSFNLLTIESQLNDLNEKRRIIQRKIIELSKDVEVCKICKGACCQGEYNHFTAIDYLLRMFSDNPIKGYGDLWKPKSINSLILDKIKRTSEAENGGNKKLETGCPNLTLNGCNLEPEDRPIRCILWTCKDFREALPRNDLKEIGNLTKELYAISDRAIKLFQKV